ncbi:uncharacterized protein LOC100903888 [Galendromus occidentalis]|uniref:Uncharacterized protein LOC100903888 n=1 Tax=Galendromus occidentalis TaxID=34638 RepID=A0AAJ6QT12_9ACAR|nr:uncharacterized protein LOC100903888 [Galendromus occidentalis]
MRAPLAGVFLLGACAAAQKGTGFGNATPDIAGDATTASSIATLVPQVSEFKCPDSIGWYPHPSNCSRFIICSEWTPFAYNCPLGLHFSAAKLRCEWPHLAKCYSTSEASPDTITPQPASGAEIVESSVSPEETIPESDTTTQLSLADGTPLGIHASPGCPPLDGDEDLHDSLRWRRWEYGETMPRDILKVGERSFETSSGRITGQFAAIVRVFYNGTSYFGTTIGPSRFANSGIYFAHNGQIAERNYEFVQILCVGSTMENGLAWVQSSKGSCAPQNAVVIDREFLVARAVHDSENGLVIASGVKQGESLITAFKSIRDHDVYEVLVKRLN